MATRVVGCVERVEGDRRDEAAEDAHEKLCRGVAIRASVKLAGL